MNMDDEELESHREALRLIQRDAQFVQQNAMNIEDENDE
jgi:hypothetical protein